MKSLIQQNAKIDTAKLQKVPLCTNLEPTIRKLRSVHDNEHHTLSDSTAKLLLARNTRNAIHLLCKLPAGDLHFHSDTYYEIFLINFGREGAVFENKFC